MGAEDDHLHWGPAETFFTFFAIHSAAPGAEVTILEKRVSLLNPLGQLPLFLQILISWDPLFFFLGYGERGGRGEEQRASKEERALDEMPPGEFHTDILLKNKNCIK
jgi:hypothetical protein